MPILMQYTSQLDFQSAANIGLHLLNPVRPGLHHRGLVNQVLVKAVALERAGAALPGGTGAGAVLHLLLGHAVGQHLLVVSVDHLFHVGAGGVGIPIVQNFKSIYAEPVPVSSQFAEITQNKNTLNSYV